MSCIGTFIGTWVSFRVLYEAYNNFTKEILSMDYSKRTNWMQKKTSNDEEYIIYKSSITSRIFRKFYRDLWRKIVGKRTNLLRQLVS